MYMLSRSQIKHIQSLQRKKYRTQHQQYIVEGPKIVAQALQLFPNKIEIFATIDWINDNKSIISDYSPLLNTISEKDLNKVSGLKTANQVLAILPIENHPLPKEIKGINVLLENIQDPGNLGTIIRNADWFGLNTVYCTPNCAEVYNSKVLQSAMGSHFNIPVIYTEVDKLIQDINIPIFGATLKGENLYTVKTEQNLLLVIGNESKGLSSTLKDTCTKEISIPGKGKAESLNAANAAAILFSYFVNS